MACLVNNESTCFYRSVFLYVDDYLLHAAKQQNNQIDFPNGDSTSVSLPLVQLHAILQEFVDEFHRPAASCAQQPLQRRFEVIAQTTPCAVAVDFNGRRLTYGELDEQADALALHLQLGGLIPGSFCLIDLEPSLALVRVMLAVLKAGGTCLQFDSRIEESTTATILAIVKPAVLFRRVGAGVTAALDYMRTIHCDEDAADLPFGWPDELPIGVRTPAHAYAMVAANGDLCVFLRTHQALELSLDNAAGARPAIWADADPGGLWRPLSHGAPLTIQARAQ